MNFGLLALFLNENGRFNNHGMLVMFDVFDDFDDFDDDVVVDGRYSRNLLITMVLKSFKTRPMELRPEDGSFPPTLSCQI